MKDVLWKYMELRTAITFLPGFLVGITVHEAAHALMSKWLGDRCAQRQGRISLNPLRHLSAAGTLLLFFVGFGWGKPVPVNLYNYKHPKLYYLITSLAGPAANLIVAATLFMLPLGVRFLDLNKASMASDMVLYGIMINLILAIINLVPIPPLDGSKIWPCLIPGLRPVHSDKTMTIWIIVLFLIFIFQGPNKILSYGGRRLTTFAINRIKQKELHLPRDFPEELRVPQGAYHVRYNRTPQKTGESRGYSVSFWLFQPHPATEYREYFRGKMSEFDWRASDNDDPNNWEIDIIKTDQDGQYSIIEWKRRWQKENRTINTRIWYYTDPNGLEKDEVATIESIYTIVSPEADK